MCWVTVEILQVGHACVIEQLGDVQARLGWQDADGKFYWPKGFRSRRTFPSMKQEGKCSYNCEVLPSSLFLLFPLFFPSHSREGMATERCLFHRSLAYKGTPPCIVFSKNVACSLVGYRRRWWFALFQGDEQ